MLTTQQLLVFEAVAREGSIGAAAHVLECSQPTVSHHIATLERQLGTALFVREPRGVLLTDRGRALLRHAEIALSEIAAAERSVQGLIRLRDGVMRVGAFASAFSSFLPSVLRKFSEQHPGISVTLTECLESTKAIEEVRARRLDIGIVYTVPGHWVRPVAGVAVRPLRSDPILVAMRADDPRAAEPNVAIADLAGDRWIVSRSAQEPCHRLLVEAAAAAAFTPKLAVRVDDIGAMGQSVAAGLGLSLIPALAAPCMPDGVVLREVKGSPIAREISAVLLSDGWTLAGPKFVEMLYDSELAADSRA
jgi:DNA-binding transcriptional LysR family regulator